jgi:WD40 repeat protein
VRTRAVEVRSLYCVGAGLSYGRKGEGLLSILAAAGSDGDQSLTPNPTPNFPPCVDPQTPIILWDFEAGAAASGQSSAPADVLRHRLILHKVAIQSLAFSSDGEFLASLGSQDDNALAVWETGSGRAVCGQAAGSYSALSVAWLNGRNDKIITAGQYNVRAWDFNYERRRCTPDDYKVGGIKRIFTCLAVNDSNSMVYAGSSTGDVLAFSVDSGALLGQTSHRFSLGVLSLAIVNDYVYCGTGDGALVRVSAKDLTVKKAAELMGGVTSIALSADASNAFCGTSGGAIYGVNLSTLETQLRGTAPSQAITDLVFPSGTSEIFITASGSDIRLWHAVQRRELLRIQVPNQNCLCVAVNRAGSTIISGWDDGKVRAFSPESGKLLFTIADAHIEAVTAIAFTNAGTKVVTGGKDGRVRTWALGARSQTMELSFKEHKKEVTSVAVSANDEEALSSSADGSCVVWNLRRGVRTNAFFSSTVFRGITYHPDESQIITVGSDRKISYWDSSDCTAIRVMDGSTEEVRASSQRPSTRTLDVQSGDSEFLTLSLAFRPLFH